jgi:hypothetical protein
MRARSAAVAVAGLVVGFAPAVVHARPSPPVQGAPADDGTRARAEEVLPSSPCRTQLLGELQRGRGEGKGCAAERLRLGRALTRGVVARSFGFVERRDVQLAVVQLTLGHARRCKTWPLRSQGRDVLDPRDVEAARCRQGRYEGPVAVTLVDGRGRRLSLPPLFADADGKLRVVISDLDATVRASGHGALGDWDRIELGRAAWAGAVDLRRLRSFRADWHLSWVVAGRGVPALFSIAHPDHAGDEQVRALAVEAHVARQRRDFEAVRAGRMAPEEFLARHAWSPYRRAVEDIAGGRVSPPLPPNSE